MLKQVELHGKRFEFCSLDGGRTWSTDARSLIAFQRRQKAARDDLRRRLEEISDKVEDLDPDAMGAARLPKGSAGAY